MWSVVWPEAGRVVCGCRDQLVWRKLGGPLATCQRYNNKSRGDSQESEDVAWHSSGQLFRVWEVAQPVSNQISDNESEGQSPPSLGRCRRGIWRKRRQENERRGAQWRSSAAAGGLSRASGPFVSTGALVSEVQLSSRRWRVSRVSAARLAPPPDWSVPTTVEGRPSPGTTAHRPLASLSRRCCCLEVTLKVWQLCDKVQSEKSGTLPASGTFASKFRLSASELTSPCVCLTRPRWFCLVNRTPKSPTQTFSSAPPWSQRCLVATPPVHQATVNRHRILIFPWMTVAGVPTSERHHNQSGKRTEIKITHTVHV